MWNPSHQPNQGTKLQNLRIKRGKWEFSEVLRDLLTAQEWGYKDPWEFWSLSPTKKALMIAAVEAKYEMSAYEDQVSRSESTPDPKLKDKY